MFDLDCLSIKYVILPRAIDEGSAKVVGTLNDNRVCDLTSEVGMSELAYNIQKRRGTHVKEGKMPQAARRLRIKQEIYPLG